MTRYSTVIRRRKKRLPGFIPESWQAFIARRLMDIIGGAFALAGFALLVALATYSPADPSWNTAGGNHAVANWLGAAGAHVSDLLLQTLGLAGAVPGIVAILWGFRIFKRHSLRPVWFRTVCTLLAMMTAAVALARVPSGGWLVHPWLGGSGGTLMLNQFASIVQNHNIAAAITGVLSFLILLPAVAVSREEISTFFAHAWNLTKVAGAFIWANAVAFVDWVKHYNDPDYAPARPRTPEIKREKPRRAPKVEAADEDEGDEESEDEEDGAEAPALAAPARVVTPKKSASPAAAKKKQTSFALDGGEWTLPPLDLLQEA
ncbi:MAG TPA: DNA translocase FtsK 4TM domain-containing protein, partial [Alphaproteobacteria bacterium]